MIISANGGFCETAQIQPIYLQHWAELHKIRQNLTVLCLNFKNSTQIQLDWSLLALLRYAQIQAIGLKSTIFIGSSHTFRIYFRPLLFLSLTSQITPHIVPYTFWRNKITTIFNVIETRLDMPLFCGVLKDHGTQVPS